MEIQDEAKVKDVQKDWKTAALNTREKALCSWAEKLTLHPAEMTEDDLKPLRENGLGDEAILDLAQVVSYFNYINRMADGLGVDLEAFMSDPHTG